MNKREADEPRKTSKRDDNKILDLSLADKFRSATRIRPKFNEKLVAPISLTTVERRLREGDLFGRIAVRKPLLRPGNKRKRLLFAKDHENLSIDQWKNVLWSDESKFELFGFHRRKYYRRKVNKRYHSKCIVPTVKYGGGSTMV